MKHRSKHHPETNCWAEICSLGFTCIQLFWAQVVVRKWLNITAVDSDYSADADTADDDYLDLDSETQEFAECSTGRESRFKVNKAQVNVDPGDVFPRLKRRMSETFRAQYINSKELRICVGSWNVGGKLPPDDLDIDEWIDINDPADIYVLGFQEVVPLNAGNIFGYEDETPVAKWENIIHETLKRIRHNPTKIKCFSDPPSLSKFKPFEDSPDILHGSDSNNDSGEEEIHPWNEESNDHAELDVPVVGDLERIFFSLKRLEGLNSMKTEDSARNTKAPVSQGGAKLPRMLSGPERIGLCWPEPPLNLVSQRSLERPKFFKSTKIKSTTNDAPSGIAFLADLFLDSVRKQRRRSSYVRILSKQMVGVFLTIWVRRGLRRHIQNVKVSTVGVGVMGYIGNKGSISVSMSIYQTFFCFVCTHLTSGENEGEKLKRNADVHEIHRRTLFRSMSGIGLPRSIYDHERIIWLGDLNYRLNLSYESTKELISEERWSELFESDQLSQELRKGRAFDGWSEGIINFPPTYKYEMDSEIYYGEDPRVVRRTPAWCDRVLSYGKGLKQLSYRRSELRLSDHRPVTAMYMAEVEVFSPKKLQRALTYTDAETENEKVVLRRNDALEIGTSEYFRKLHIS